MNSKNIILDKTYSLSLEVTRLCINLQKTQKEFVLTHQLIKSATSVGANVEEAQGSQSRKDFLTKISIAYKESLETKYWLRLIKDLKLEDLDK